MLPGHRDHSQGAAAFPADGGEGDRRPGAGRAGHKEAALAGERRAEQPALYAERQDLKSILVTGWDFLKKKRRQGGSAPSWRRKGYDMVT